MGHDDIASSILGFACHRSIDHVPGQCLDDVHFRSQPVGTWVRWYEGLCYPAPLIPDVLALPAA
eukprot:2949412-Heterocapsa_arctica.AAC.1